MADHGGPDHTTEHSKGVRDTVIRSAAALRWTDASGARSAVITEQAIAGSAAHVSLVIHDAAVSRIHAELKMRPDGLWIEDVGSRNGTFINGLKITNARAPQSGQVTLGGVVITVTYDTPPQAVAQWPHERFGPLLGRSAIMRTLFHTLSRFAAKDATVLIQGETGTGKEMVARAIHEASPRAGNKFVVFDCGRATESLNEDALFGHNRGAFTGAAAPQAGAIEEADGGTVFLDEIGELSPSLQTQLLRAVDGRMVRRIGSTEYKYVNVRFLAATHRNLRRMVNDGAFREDLYFRLAVLPVMIPPLRERPEDIPLLLQHLLGSHDGAALPPAELRLVMARPWLGNVRELRNFAERVQVLGDVAQALELTGPDEWRGLLPPVSIDRPYKEIRDEWLAYIEREYLRQMLAKHGGNVTATATAAGLDRSHVHELLRKHKLR